MSKIIAKYRKEADDWYQNQFLHKEVTLRAAILESIFKPVYKLPEGKGAFTHLHPDSKKLHLPPGCYISDWRKYRVEDHPSLINHQKRCHAAGLHDPWLRNYACMHYPSNNAAKSRMRVITTGLGFGFCAGLALFLAEKIYDQFYPTVYRHTPEYIAKHGTGEIHH